MQTLGNCVPLSYYFRVFQYFAVIDHMKSLMNTKLCGMLFQKVKRFKKQKHFCKGTLSFLVIIYCV